MKWSIKDFDLYHKLDEWLQRRASQNLAYYHKMEEWTTTLDQQEEKLRGEINTRKS